MKVELSIQKGFISRIRLSLIFLKIALGLLIPKFKRKILLTEVIPVDENDAHMIFESVNFNPIDNNSTAHSLITLGIQREGFNYGTKFKNAIDGILKEQFLNKGEK